MIIKIYMKKIKIILIAFILIFGVNNVLASSNLEIKLNGQEEITIVKGNKYQEQGVVVRGDDILKVETTGTVIENTVGTYLITYTATDKAGNISTKTRTVTVVEQPNILSENYIPERVEPVTEQTDGEVLGVNKFIFTQKLNFGLKNNEVVELHKKLIAEGFLKIASPTGYFGSQTLKAVKDFQLVNNLTADGIVGPKTREALNR